jgi:hypothetical protein
MTRVLRLVVMSAMVLLAAQPALAQQTVNVTLGRFFLPTQRGATDLLDIEHADLVFEVGEFNGNTIGVEWLLPFRERFEAGFGISYFSGGVDTVHSRTLNPDGTPIPRSLALSQVPLAFTARYLPLRNTYRVQPYLGGGFLVTAFNFSETGDFVVPNGRIFRDEHYSVVKPAFGTTIIAGLRMAGRRWAYGVETRRTYASGDFGDAFAQVREPDIDLGGWTAQATVGIRFRN